MGDIAPLTMVNIRLRNMLTTPKRLLWQRAIPKLCVNLTH